MGPRTVLVVDDDDAVRNSLIRELRRRGVRALEACDVAGARQIAETEQPDCAAVDLRLDPREMALDQSGLVAIHGILAVSPNTQVVLLTGYGTCRATMDAIELGAVDCLDKPVGVEGLLEVFEKFAGARQAMRATRPAVMRVLSITTSRHRFEIPASGIVLRTVTTIDDAHAELRNHLELVVVDGAYPEVEHLVTVAFELGHRVYVVDAPPTVRGSLLDAGAVDCLHPSDLKNLASLDLTKPPLRMRLPRPVELRFRALLEEPMPLENRMKRIEEVLLAWAIVRHGSGRRAAAALGLVWSTYERKTTPDLRRRARALAGLPPLTTSPPGDPDQNTGPALPCPNLGIPKPNRS